MLEETDRLNKRSDDLRQKNAQQTERSQAGARLPRSARHVKTVWHDDAASSSYSSSKLDTYLPALREAEQSRLANRGDVLCSKYSSKKLQKIDIAQRLHA